MREAACLCVCRVNWDWGTGGLGTVSRGEGGQGGGVKLGFKSSRDVAGEAGGVVQKRKNHVKHCTPKA